MEGNSVSLDCVKGMRVYGDVKLGLKNALFFPFSSCGPIHEEQHCVDVHVSVRAHVYCTGCLMMMTRHSFPFPHCVQDAFSACMRV